MNISSENTRHPRSSRLLGAAAIAALLLAVPATLTAGTAVADSGATGDESTPGYVFHLGENGYEPHWVDNPEEMSFYYNYEEGKMYWNPGQSY